jgi:hypothetical protein
MQLGDQQRTSLSRTNLEIVAGAATSNGLQQIQESLRAPAARIGFLDFTTEVMVGRLEYAEVISFGYYARSLVDNLLTPGFDLFDTPKAANALKGLYTNGRPANKAEVSDAYHSDQFTVYGEFFVLFGGWWALGPLWVVGWAFGRAWQLPFGDFVFAHQLARTFIAYLFLNTLFGFGIDWVLPVAVGLMMSLLITAQLAGVITRGRR